MKQSRKILSPESRKILSLKTTSQNYSSKNLPFPRPRLNPFALMSFKTQNDFDKAHDYAKRFYNSMAVKTQPSYKISVNLEEERRNFFEKLEEIHDELRGHEALNHPFFKYLESKSQSGFNKFQFSLYLLNFIFRTKTTAPVVASTIARALFESDIKSANKLYQNLKDEIGNGDESKAHPNLLISCHMMHLERVFGAEALSTQEIEKSPFILDQAKLFRDMKLLMFHNLCSYPLMAGNLWAHEMCADDMLNNFRKSIFEPYKKYYKPGEWDQLMEFFEAHHGEDGNNLVELRHQQDAKESVFDACDGKIEYLDDVKIGAMMFMDIQSRLWASLQNALEKAEHLADKVPLIPVSQIKNEIQSFDEVVEQTKKTHGSLELLEKILSNLEKKQPKTSPKSSSKALGFSSSGFFLTNLNSSSPKNIISKS